MIEVDHNDIHFSFFKTRVVCVREREGGQRERESTLCDWVSPPWHPVHLFQDP